MQGKGSEAASPPSVWGRRPWADQEEVGMLIIILFYISSILIVIIILPNLLIITIVR